MSEIAAIAASTPLKMFFVCCCSFQEQLRDTDLEVDHLVVPAGEHALHHVGNPGDVLRVAHAYDHAIELMIVESLGTLLRVLVGVRVRVIVALARRLLHVLLGDERAVAVTQQHRRERHVHVHVRVADAELLRRLIRDFAVLEHADDREPHVADLDRLADRLLGGEEPRLDAVPDDGDGRAVGHLDRCEALALGHIEVEQVEVGRVDAPRPCPYGGGPRG